jgi:hypothetical protein
LRSKSRVSLSDTATVPSRDRPIQLPLTPSSYLLPLRSD